MKWEKILKTFSSEEERDIFNLLLEESAKNSNLLVAHLSTNDNGIWDSKATEYYAQYYVTEKIIISKEEILRNN